MNEKLFSKQAMKLIENKDLEKLKSFNLQHPNYLDFVDEFSGDGSLTLAIKSGSYEILEYLLSNGVNPDQAAKDVGHTALHEASSLENEKALDLLLRFRCDVNLQGGTSSYEKDCALSQSSRNGNLIFVKKLLNAGADVSLLNEEQENALFYCDNEEIVKLLISCGAVVNQINLEDATPLDLTNSLACAFYLIKSGARHGEYGHNSLGDMIRFIFLHKMAELLKGNSTFSDKLSIFCDSLDDDYNNEEVYAFEDSLTEHESKIYRDAKIKVFLEIEKQYSSNLDEGLRKEFRLLTEGT